MKFAMSIVLLPAIAIGQIDLGVDMPNIEDAYIAAKKNEAARAEMRANENTKASRWRAETQSAETARRARRIMRTEMTAAYTARMARETALRVAELWSIAAAMRPQSVRDATSILPASFRAVGEAATPRNQQERANQLQEIRWFAKRGFDAVLFAYQGEDPERAGRAVETIVRATNMRVIWTYGPEESEHPYDSPVLIHEAIKKAAANIDAIIPLWRLSSGPHLNSGTERINRSLILGGMAQKYGDIAVWGEWFAPDGPATIPDGSHTVVMQNAGVLSVVEREAVQKCRDATSQKHVIPVIVGPAYYYDSFRKADMTRAEIWTMKQASVAAYEQAGARGSIVLVGDGAGQRRENKSKLTHTSWRNMK